MKNIVAVGMAILFFVGAFAQQNDTMLLRKLKVTEIEKFQRVHALLGTNDTCLMEYKKLNKYGLDTFLFTDFGCSGYKQKNVVRSQYNERKVIRQFFEQNGKKYGEVTYKYNGKTDVLSSKTAIEATSGKETVTTYTYYKKKRAKLVDSTRITVKNEETTNIFLTRNTYDKKKRLVSSTTEDGTGQKIQETVNIRGADGKIESTANATFMEKPTFVQTFYKYDQEGRVVETNDTHNRQNIFLYTTDGLLSNIMGYNAKGELEVEFIYKYTFGK